MVKNKFPIVPILIDLKNHLNLKFLNNKRLCIELQNHQTNNSRFNGIVRMYKPTTLRKSY